MKLGLLSDELKELFLSFSVDLLDVNILEYLLETPFVDCITDERGLRIRDLPAYINNLSRGIRLTKHLTEQSDAFSPTVRVFEFDIDKELGLWEKEKVNCIRFNIYIYRYFPQISQYCTQFKRVGQDRKICDLVKKNPI